MFRCFGGLGGFEFRPLASGFRAGGPKPAPKLRSPNGCGLERLHSFRVLGFRVSGVAVRGLGFRV